MKRVWVAVGILAALALFSVWGHCAVNTATATLEQGVEQLLQTAEQGELAQSRQLAADLQRYCTEKEELLTLFVKRDLVSNLRISLSGLQAYIQKDYLPDLFLEAARVKAQLHALRCQYYSMA